jgi:hypothetical protein
MVPGGYEELSHRSDFSSSRDVVRLRPSRTQAIMKLTPLYRQVFHYPDGWSLRLDGPGGRHEAHFYIAHGRCEGQICGTLRGWNRPTTYPDLTMRADFHAIIETVDGAVIFCDASGYGRDRPDNQREIVVAATHLTDDPRYAWLNHVLCLGTGHVTSRGNVFQASPGPEGGSRPRVRSDVEYHVDFWQVAWDPPPGNVALGDS